MGKVLRAKDHNKAKAARFEVELQSARQVYQTDHATWKAAEERLTGEIRQKVYRLTDTADLQEGEASEAAQRLAETRRNESQPANDHDHDDAMEIWEQPPTRSRQDIMESLAAARARGSVLRF